MKLEPMFFLLFLMALLWQGCASYRTTATVPKMRPLGENMLDVRRAGADEKQAPERTVADSGEALTLRTALQLALLHNPELAAFSYEIRIREARALQESFLPNPELSLETENVGGSGEFRGTRSAETTLQLGQLLELGNKRRKRTRVAALESDLAGWDYEARRLNVYVVTVAAYVNVVAAQEKVQLNKELVELAENFLDNIQKRVKAGKDSPAEAARAEVELANARIALQQAEKQLHTARQQLATMWGGTTLRFTQVRGELSNLVSVPGREMLLDFIEQNPDIARWTVELELRNARLESEKAQRIPDPVISGGVRRLNEAKANAFVLGVSVPIFLFNRNQGNIQAAEIARRQAEKLREAVFLAVRNELVSSYNRLSAVRQEIDIIQTQSLPRAREAFDVIREGYLSGRFGFLDVLDAQRTLFEVRSRYVDALAEFHQDVAVLERLTGQRIDGIF